MTTASRPMPARLLASVDVRVVAAGGALVAFLLVLLLRLWLKWEGPLPGDRWAHFHLQDAGLAQPWRDFGTFYSVIGGPPVAFWIGCWALWFVGRAAGLQAMGFVALSCLGVVANGVVKVASGPTSLMYETAGHSSMPNFPSGHTVYAVVLFGSIAWLAWVHRRRDISLVLILLILGMGPFRVIADAHFVSDVIAGYLFGIGWLLCAALATGVGGTVPSFRVGRGRRGGDGPRASLHARKRT